MKFWYTPVVIRSADTGEPATQLRPMVPLVVLGEVDAVLCSALVDTGADNSFLPRSIAEALGLLLTSCRGPAPVAFGGGIVETYYTDLVLQLGDGTDEVAWPARMLVFDVDSPSDEIIILGHTGFLEHFRATFDGQAGTLDLEPLPSMPAVDVE